MTEERPVTAHRIAVIPGDGIGPEVIAEGLKVMAAAVAGSEAQFETTTYDLGARRWHATGELLPDTVLAELDLHDAILLGAVGDPSVPSGILERGLLLRLRFALDHYVNLRPVVLYPGVATPLAGRKPADIDMVVIREGTEGLYCGAGGAVASGTVREVATEESLNTRTGVERVVRYAAECAAARPRRTLTMVHKTNVLVHAGDLWSRTVQEIAEEYPEITVNYCHVDAAAMFFVTDPGRFDVVVTDNLFGDILTDLGAAIAGGIGLAASGNLNPVGEHPSMFEPVHGSAPDIAGQQRADPTATIISVALLLRHRGLDAAADRVERAVIADLASRGHRVRSTTEIGDAIVAQLA
jgi:3-isopropylmalate dehydrogenase